MQALTTPFALRRSLIASVTVVPVPAVACGAAPATRHAASGSAASLRPPRTVMRWG